MILLQGLHHAGQLSIVLGGGLHSVLLRFASNWAVVVLLSGLIKWRRAVGFQKLYRDQEQQQQQQEPERPSGCNPLPSNGQKQPHEANGLFSNGDAHGKQGPVHIDFTFLAMMGRDSTLAALSPSAPATAAAEPSPKEAPGQLRAAPALEPAAQGMGVSSGLAALRHMGLTVQQQHTARALLEAVTHERALPYMRSRDSDHETVCVKMEGIELHNLPPGLAQLLHGQVRQRMPDVTMTGLALRSGCVIMTLDLEHLTRGRRGRPSADGMTKIITCLVQSLPAEHMPENGATMCIQARDGLTFCQWDSVSGSYLVVGSSGWQALDILDSVVWTSCRMLSAQPAVCGLPASSGSSASAATSQTLTLTVELELPSNCPLHGWHPAGVAPPAEPTPQDKPAVNAMLLARRLDGGYLPVGVQCVQHTNLDSDGSATPITTAQVMIAVDGVAPAALRLELWCKDTAANLEVLGSAAAEPAGSTDQSVSGAEQPDSTGFDMPGTELLVSHMPLLVLPHSWKQAADELQQHIKQLGGAWPRHVLSTPADPADRCMDTAHDLCGDGITPPTSPHQLDADSCPSFSLSSQSLGGPSPIAASPAVLCLLEDLGAWLARTHHSIGSPQSPRLEESSMSQMGDDLLVYAVQHGLDALASMLVSNMQRLERLLSAPSTAEFSRPMYTTANSSGTPNTWLQRVSGTGGDGSRQHTSLLHAAMASGNSNSLAQVLRWGTLYGGQDWAWPWELEDETDCTALHLAAAQPAAGACATLLKTITCMLPAAQVQAARNVWMTGLGGVGTTPAELFAAVSNGGSVDVAWRSTDSPGPSQPHNAAPSPACPLSTSSTANPAGATGSGSSTAIAVRPSTDGTSVHGNAALPSVSAAALSNRQRVEFTNLSLKPYHIAQSWFNSIVEVWVAPETDEYRAWAKQQMSGLVYSWAAAVLLVSVVACITSSRAGYRLYEVPEIYLHAVAYIPMAAATRGTTWLGDWQAWMLSAHIFHSLAYLATAYPVYRTTDIWNGAVANGSDIVYVVLLTSLLDQAPLPKLLIVQALEAFFHGLDYKAAGLRYPMLRGFLVHGLALLVTNVARARQLRAYHRWQAVQQSNRQAAMRRMIKRE